MLLPTLDSAPEDRLALAFDEATLTYAQLRAAAGRVAARLDGVSRVAVLAEPRAETCVAVIGALLAGVPAVPLNPKSGASELAHVVGDAAPEALLLAPGSPVPEAFDRRSAIEVDLKGGADAQAAARPVEAGPEDPALIVYTSGTTGPPKGAVMPRRAIASNLDALAEIWDWTAEDVVAHALPLFHVHGLVVGVLGPVRRGGTVRHLGRFSPEAVLGAFTAEPPAIRATMLFGVPTMYRRLADAAVHRRD
ncbi:MAG: AMP-binding protein, partial [Solirubrobacteraceae bacterium]